MTSAKKVKRPSTLPQFAFISAHVLPKRTAPSIPPASHSPIFSPRLRNIEKAGLRPQILVTSQTKSNPKRRRLFVLAISLALLLVVIPIVLSTRQPRVEVSLTNEPVLRFDLQPLTYPAGLQTNTALTTPEEFHATLQFKNLGPGSILFEVPTFYHLEIRLTNSPVWQETGTTNLRFAPPLRPGAAFLHPIRIPVDAVQFRIRTRYRSWNTARETTKDILRKTFNFQFSPEPFYMTESPAWDIPVGAKEI